MSALATLFVGDPADAWRAAGFSMDGESTTVDGIVISCLDDGLGASRWAVRTDADLPDTLDGISTTTVDAAPAVDPPTDGHPNRVVSLDHVVLRSPDLDRTTDVLVDAGLDLRRIREVPGSTPFEQRFFRFDNAILELVGPSAATGDGPATIWGFAFVVDDIDAAAAHLGPHCSPPKDAVQPGRRIATVRTAELGIEPTIALMTPHVRRPDTR